VNNLRSALQVFRAVKADSLDTLARPFARPVVITPPCGLRRRTFGSVGPSREAWGELASRVQTPDREIEPCKPESGKAKNAHTCYQWAVAEDAAELVESQLVRSCGTVA
jgi:hypothetical protein